MKFSATVKQMPEFNVVCMRHLGPYNQIGTTIEKLLSWAGPKGLIQFPKTQILVVYHDNPETTPAIELRSDACITIPEGTTSDEQVKTMKIPGGQFAVAHVELDKSEYSAAWDKLLNEWMPRSGCKPDEARLCYELYLNNPEEHPKKKHIVDICEPIVS